jgi:hypothetical protein
MQSRHPNGRYRGRQPIRVTPETLRARWVRSEAFELLKKGHSYHAIALHITKVGRHEISPVVPIPLLVSFPKDYRISAPACFKACRYVLKRRKQKYKPTLERLLFCYQLDQMYLALQPRIGAGDPVAVNSAIRIRKEHGRLMGYLNRKGKPIRTKEKAPRENHEDIWPGRDRVAEILEIKQRRDDLQRKIDAHTLTESDLLAANPISNVGGREEHKPKERLAGNLNGQGKTVRTKPKAPKEDREYAFELSAEQADALEKRFARRKKRSKSRTEARARRAAQRVNRQRISELRKIIEQVEALRNRSGNRTLTEIENERRLAANPNTNDEGRD